MYLQHCHFFCMLIWITFNLHRLVSLKQNGTVPLIKLALILPTVCLKLVLFSQPLFMSADNSSLSGSTERSTSAQTVEPQPEMTGEKGEESDSEGEWLDTRGKDCVVCQNAPTNRVLLPCRHACVCDGCVCRFQHCPICRAFVLESFALSNRPTSDMEEDVTED